MGAIGIRKGVLQTTGYILDIEVLSLAYLPFTYICMFSTRGRGTVYSIMSAF